MLTNWDLDEAVAVIAADRDAVGEPVTWRDYQGSSGMPPVPQYTDTTIHALFRPVSPGLITSGFYLMGDLEMITSVEVVPNDLIVRFGVTYQVLDAPFVRRVGDRVIGYETKVRKV